MARFDLLPKFVSLRSIAKAAALIAVLGVLTACGGGSAPASSTTPTPAPTPAPITGVAIPSSVSVVTATNAS